MKGKPNRTILKDISKGDIVTVRGEVINARGEFLVL